MAQNLMKRAAAYRKKHPKMSMAQAVKAVAASDRGAKKIVSSTKSNNMARPRKKKAAPRKKTASRRVSGVGRTTTTVRKTSTKRKSVGAIVDRHMFKLALGMGLSTIVDQMVVQPLKDRVPVKYKLLTDPAMIYAGYKVSTKFKDPIVQGIGLALMNSGVAGTAKTILTRFPMLKMQSTPGMAGDEYYQLPNPSMGEIPQYLGEIPQYLGNINNSSMPNIGEMGDIAPADELIMPLGTHGGYL